MAQPESEASAQARDAAAGEPLACRVCEVLSARPEVLEAYLFGSQATGAARRHSDVDIAVYVDPHALRAARGYGYEAALTADLITALGRNDVDVVVPIVLRHCSIIGCCVTEPGSSRGLGRCWTGPRPPGHPFGLVDRKS